MRNNCQYIRKIRKIILETNEFEFCDFLKENTVEVLKNVFRNKIGFEYR